ncbi:MAG: hypothetical protein ACJ8GN_19080 [Longimicrobiaceae bacterium]
MNTAPAAVAAKSDPQHLALARASNALWLATLSLMTAFMQTAAPAHRYLIARRIARNFDTLREQDCFTTESRASFARLSMRWQERAARLAPAGDRPRGGIGIALLHKLLPR